MMRLRRQRDMQRHDVGLSKQLIQRSSGCRLLGPHGRRHRQVRIEADDAHADQTPEPTRHAANAAETDQAKRFAGKLAPLG